MVEDKRKFKTQNDATNISKRKNKKQKKTNTNRYAAKKQFKRNPQPMRHIHQNGN